MMVKRLSLPLGKPAHQEALVRQKISDGPALLLFLIKAYSSI